MHEGDQELERSRKAKEPWRCLLHRYGWCQVHSDGPKTRGLLVSLFVKKWPGSVVCLPSGPFVWEEAEEVQCVASYPERGHLAWLTDNTPTVQRAVMSQVLMQTLPQEPERMRTGSKKKTEAASVISRSAFSCVSCDIHSSHRNCI